MFWHGTFMGEPNGKRALKSSYVSGLSSITLSIWLLSSTYCSLIIWIISRNIRRQLNYSHKINGNFSLYTEAGYDFNTKI